MRAITMYRGITISTNLGGGFYFAARGGWICRLTLADIRGEIDSFLTGV